MNRAFFFLLLLTIFQPFQSFAQDDAVGLKMQQLAKQLADALKSKSKTRVGVTDLTDLQGYPTELGTYLAIELQSSMVNNGLRVINRQRLEQLLIENKLTAKGIVDPENALKLKKAAGMEVIIIGTLTPFEKTVTINVLALDLEGAEAIASAKASIPRTQDVDALLRNFSKQTVVQYNEQGPGAGSPDNSEKVMEKGECQVGETSYGIYRFENRFTKPILLYKEKAYNDTDLNILIAPGAVGMPHRSYISTYAALDVVYYFRTTSPPLEEGFLTLTVSKCKSKFISLTPANLHLSKPKSN